MRLSETETSVRSINMKKWNFIRSPYWATWLDINKLSAASDHSYTLFDRTLTCETGTLAQVDTTETGPGLVPHWHSVSPRLKIDSVDLSLSICGRSRTISFRTLLEGDHADLSLSIFKRRLGRSPMYRYHWSHSNAYQYSSKVSQSYQCYFCAFLVRIDLHCKIIYFWNKI